MQSVSHVSRLQWLSQLQLWVATGNSELSLCVSITGLRQYHTAVIASDCLPLYFNRVEGRGKLHWNHPLSVPLCTLMVSQCASGEGQR